MYFAADADQNFFNFVFAQFEFHVNYDISIRNYISTCELHISSAVFKPVAAVITILCN